MSSIFEPPELIDAPHTMSNAKFTVPVAINEPIQAYTPDSPERVELNATLAEALTPSEQKDGSEAKSQYTEVALAPRCVGKLRKNC